MISPINSALSGLAASSNRIAVSANNIANISSTKSIVDGKQTDQPYVPKRVDQVSLENGGVGVKVRDVAVPSITVPATDGSENATKLPNVDLAQEAINQKLASYDFKANLKVIKTVDEMQQSLLDILS